MFRQTSEKDRFESFKAQWSTGNHLVSVDQLLPRAVAAHGDKPALIEPDRTLTYRQWWFYTLSMVTKLERMGVKAGDRVVLYATNSCEFYISYFAIWHLGAIVVPLNVYLHEREMAGILRDADPAAIVLLASMTDKMHAARDLAPTVTAEQLILDDSFWQQHHYSRTRLDQLDAVCPAIHRKLSDTAVILYTSGTTGVPKGVMLSSRNVVTNALQVLARFDSTVTTDGHERFFSVLPLFHVFAQNACMWLPVMLGSAIIIVPRIDRRAILNGLQHKPTMFFGFPALFGLLVMMRNAPLDAVKLFVSGADALPDKIRMAFALVYGRKIASGYGLTEASPVIAVDHSSYDNPTNVVGTPVVGVTCQIRDDNEVAVPTGSVGTLWVKGDNVMQGYYNAPELTAPILKNGWLNTGDLATIDADGVVAIVGRCKDVIINKGFNIYPQEIENVLLRHPAVIKAAVVGKADGDVGQIPVAYVAVREGQDLTQDEIAKFCKQNLAVYKVPKSITCLADLPMTATGKIDKKQLGS